MLKNVVFPLLSLLSFLSFTNAKADLAALIRDFYRNNKGVKQAQAQIELASLDLQSIEGKRSWMLSTSVAYDKNDLDSPSPLPFMNRQGRALRNTFSLSKDTLWGGRLSLDHTFSDEKTVNRFLPPEIKQFGQGISYTQDLGANRWGRDGFEERKAARDRRDYRQRKAHHALQGHLVAFYQAFVWASLSKSFLHLQGKALKRAVARRRLVAQRARDGLREEVDLNQAKMDEVKQREEVKTMQRELDFNLERLSLLLHRPVASSELGDSTAFSRTPSPFAPLLVGQQQRKGGGNLNVLALEEKVNMLEGEWNRARFRLLPTVKLFTNYRTNRYHERGFQALEEGLLGGPKTRWEVGVALDIPLGFTSATIEKAKAAIQWDVARRELQSALSDVRGQGHSLLSRLGHLKGILASIKERRALAKKILQQLNDLYRLGKRNLDQVIGAEEALIRTERKFNRTLAEREQLLSELAHLHGRVRDFLLPKDKT